MYDIYCPGHGSVVLLTRHNIETFRNTDAGIEIGYRCDCGHSGTILTGRAAAAV